MSEQCEVCACNNPKQGLCAPPGVQSVGDTPFEELKVDFTEMPQSWDLKYLLVFVCTPSNWVEAYPTQTEKAQEVARLLLQEIVPQFGLPITICSDNRPAFVAEIVHLLAKKLNIKWKLHIAYRPQGSGQVERMNRTLQTQLGKLCQETHLYWDEVLPMALLRIGSAPTKKTRFSTYEILYERPPPPIKGLRGDLKEIGELTLRRQLQALETTFQTLNQWVRERLPVSLTIEVHFFKPGDSVWVKEWNIQPLKPWGGAPLLSSCLPSLQLRLLKQCPGYIMADLNTQLQSGNVFQTLLSPSRQPSRRKH